MGTPEKSPGVVPAVARTGTTLRRESTLAVAETPRVLHRPLQRPVSGQGVALTPYTGGVSLWVSRGFRRDPRADSWMAARATLSTRL